MTENAYGPKFKVKAELALFEAIQKDGRLSEEGIAKETGSSATTIHYAMDRIRQRSFFDFKAVPRMDQFEEIPLAVIGFSNVHPMKILELVKDYAHKPETMQLFHGEKDVMMMVTGTDSDALSKTLYKIMQLLEEKPSVYMTSPVVAKHTTEIPDKVLEAVYSDLPDRRFKA